jgi:hypothetical protein
MNLALWIVTGLLTVVFVVSGVAPVVRVVAVCELFAVALS